jgi:hypothetical protein
MNNSVYTLENPPIFECGGGSSRFQYVDLGFFSEEYVGPLNDLGDWIGDKPCPKFDDGTVAVYTWDYFAWLRDKKKRSKMTRSINEIGLGYCGACGMFNKMHNVDGKWECKSCGYRNIRLFDHNTKKGE